ncbi:MAG: hypothetical protein WKF73_16640 [Nocardioidaceae bacterium]
MTIWAKNKKHSNFTTKFCSCAKRLGDKSGEAITLSNIGLIYNYLGEKQKLSNTSTKPYKTLKTIGDKRGEAITLTNIGETLWKFWR